MSGRSAYVRKEKEKPRAKEGKTGILASSAKASTDSRERDPSFSDFPLPSGVKHSANVGFTSPTAPRSVLSSNSDELSYARARKPPVPIIDVSGIEKSSFRSLMDKKSEGVRKGLSSFTFGKKKKASQNDESRPATSATNRAPDGEIAELDNNPPPYLSGHSNHREGIEAIRPGPPLGKLPSLPELPQIRRWQGSGRPSQPWNKLRKDPELWDIHGDTLVYLSQPAHQEGRQPPSFRVSSHVIEATESGFLISALRQGYTDRSDSDHSHPSSSKPRKHFSETSSHDVDGQISYELHFPAPSNASKLDESRYHVTTRNAFALLYQVSLVGYNLFQALNDLQERLQIYMPPGVDSAGLVIEYVMSKGLDDARDDPTTAISLLAWSEIRSVHWHEGWGESFIHCAGMLDRLESVPEYRHVTPITKALLERASLETQVRVQSVEERLVDFDFTDMWPAMSPTPPPERGSFERLRHFFRGYYTSNYGSWPAPTSLDADQWLTRILVQQLQRDFGALYDYIVDRDVIWDCSEERSSRKWMMAYSDPQRSFEADSSELPMTDIFVAFDNRHRYPHIPHPYPLVPQSVSPQSVEYFQKASKMTRSDDKMAGRKAALAYAEATNIYILGSDFVENRLVEAFVRFEKNDMPGELDPFAGRRGRWVLIYGILQALASLSVDSPLVRYKEDVTYHLNPRLRGTPPWRGGDLSNQEAKHERSHCWLAPLGWHEERRLSGVTLHPRPPGAVSVPSSVAPSVMESDGGSSSRKWTLDDLPKLDYPNHRKSSKRSVRSSVAMSTSAESDATSSAKSPTLKTSRRAKVPTKEAEHSLPRGYGPGIEKVDENPWPIREEGRPGIDFSSADGFIVRDFDNYNF